ncbi:MAG: ferrochelatase [Deltaproteobacteria bacterium RIFOXYB2_FULL_66_7]|nr:MAG: ferrochelatase [Deltaproteobacteria bacterium RIFOXYB2_FULL_66_7]
MSGAGPVGVVLMSMGEPESPEQVRPYLRQLLSDRDLVRFPVPALQGLFAWAVSVCRCGRFRRHLAEMGGGSPLVRLTYQQKAALREAMAGSGDRRFYVAMRYGEPSSRDAARRLRADGIGRVVALPLYPQYCAATTGSSLKALKAALHDEGFDVPVCEVRSWPDHPGYIAAMAEGVFRTLSRAPGGKAHLLFCAHGVPVDFIKEGDPYQKEVEATAAALRKVFPDLPWSLAYQSRTGRGEWLGPDAADEVRRLARSGIAAVMAVPLSFVSDNSETLYDLDIALRRTAVEAGIKSFLRVPAPNESPAFIAALKDMVLSCEAEA